MSHKSCFRNNFNSWPRERSNVIKPTQTKVSSLPKIWFNIWMIRLNNGTLNFKYKATIVRDKYKTDQNETKGFGITNSASVRAKGVFCLCVSSSTSWKSGGPRADHLRASSAWGAGLSTRGSTKRFLQKKIEKHSEIVQTFLNWVLGLTFSPPALGCYETKLRNIAQEPSTLSQIFYSIS